MLPVGRFTEAPASTCRTSARVRFTPAAASGSTCTRTAGCCPPPTKTCPTPSTWAIFCASTVSAASKTCGRGRVFEVRAMIMIGVSLGFTFR